MLERRPGVFHYLMYICQAVELSLVLYITKSHRSQSHVITGDHCDVNDANPNIAVSEVVSSHNASWLIILVLVSNFNN